MEKIYLVCYSTGDYEDYRNIIIFATNSHSKAVKYRGKFNRILKKWQDYYSQFTGKWGWIMPEHVERHYDRWYMIGKIGRCYIDEVEVR